MISIIVALAVPSSLSNHPCRAILCTPCSEYSARFLPPVPIRCCAYSAAAKSFIQSYFIFQVFQQLALLPFFIFQYESMTFEQWIMLILAGIFAAFGQFGLTIAYSFAPAREISIFFYSTILFTALLSIFILNEVPDMLSVIGYFVFLGASYYMFMKNRAPKEEF